MLKFKFDLHDLHFRNECGDLQALRRLMEKNIELEGGNIMGKLIKMEDDNQFILYVKNTFKKGNEKEKKELIKLIGNNIELLPEKYITCELAISALKKDLIYINHIPINIQEDSDFIGLFIEFFNNYNKHWVYGGGDRLDTTSFDPNKKFLLRNVKSDALKLFLELY